MTDTSHHPTANKIIEAIEAGSFTPDQLWNIQVTAAAVSLEDGVGSRWAVNLPVIGVDFNEDTVSAGVMRMVTERTGATMIQMSYDGLMTDGRLLYEFIRAHMIVMMGRDAADVEAILDRIPQVTLLEGVTMEATNPDPKEPSGTMYPNVKFGNDPETPPLPGQEILFNESAPSSTPGGASTT